MTPKTTNQNKSTDLKKVLIFAGAGASKAVNKDFYLTTKDYYLKLPDSIKKDQVFAYVQKFCDEHYGKKTAVDIEQVLWTLHELNLFAQEATNPSSVLGWFFQDGRIMSAANQGYNVEPFVAGLRKYISAAENLTGLINQQVYKLYSREPEQNELEQNWLFLLEGLQSIFSECAFEIFTTNYDLVMETVFEILERKNHFHVITGRVGNVKPHFDLVAWKDIPRVIPNKYIRLTKLHGSVDWIRLDDGSISVGTTKYTGNHSDHIIIYPGFKGDPNDEPFTSFHNHFVEQVNNAQIIIFIGFAFRDDYINQVLESIQGRPEIHIIDPAPDLSFPIKRIKPLRYDYFNKDVTEKILNHIRGNF